MTGEIAAFQAFKAGPSSDALIGLLRAQQERIFRLCFQVLHNAADAEDAAQGALLKIVDEVRRFDDPESFQRWLYRVSLNAALETARKAARRRAHEARAAMQKSAPAPADPDERLALFEAMAGLDDASRAFLLRHFLEGEPLQSIAESSGYSVSGVSRRMERARESLRRRLVGAGAMAAQPNLEALFPAAPMSPELVTGAVLARAKTVAATLAAGGIALSTKTSFITAVAITAIICLAGGTGFGVLLKSRADRAPTARVEKRDRPFSPPLGSSVSPESSDKFSATVRAKDGSANPAAPEASEGSSLTARLDRYRAWMKTWDEEKAALGEKLILDDQFKIRHYTRKRRELAEELEGMRDLILSDPRPFLDFFKAPENGAWLDDLVDYGFGFITPDLYGFQGRGKTPLGEFPTALTRGLLDLLASGTSPQKGAALSFFGYVSDPPGEFEARWVGLLEDSDPGVQMRAAKLVSQIPNVPPEFLSTLMQVGRTSGHVWVRTEVANAMARIPSPEAQTYLLERLETATEAHEVVSLTCAMTSKFYAASSGGPAVPQERFLRAASDALSRGLGDETLRYVVMSVLFIPAERARPVIERARAAASTAGFQRAMTDILEKIDAGKTNRDELTKLLWSQR